MDADLAPLQLFGVLLLVLGAILFILPVVLERLPSLEKVPWIILYVYRSDGFVFVTSPILIIISVLSFLLYILRYRI
ncbi:MAG: hypothetical protein Metus_0248 [Candidatus Methanosuratincola subterraneus]|uniref:DUF2905 domain-containing protein n=1 Tax=Methanosuratincola subterraneus TaxID=2593994 RepID=A0A3S3TTD4_METS7|nr:MAG: hypothetical protein Metus_0248 [Candidatus Methanosuratincola subterraneus]